MGALLPTRQTAPCIQPQGGLSPPVQQSRSSLRMQWESLHQSHLFAYSASVRALPSGAAGPRLPSVAVWPLCLSLRVALRARWRTGLSLPVQQSRWPPSDAVGALHPRHQTAPHIQPQGGLSLPVQQSRKLPSDAVRVPPSVASLCLFSIGRGSSSGAADPRLPSVAVWRLRRSFRVALRARWRTGLSLPVQQSRWLPSVVMGALLPTRQTAPCIKPQGGLSPPVQQSRSSLRTQWESLHQSHLFAYLALNGALPSGAAGPRLPSVAVWPPPSVIWVTLRTRRQAGLSLPVQ